jgi:hypothetical protein
MFSLSPMIFFQIFIPCYFSLNQWWLAVGMLFSGNMYEAFNEILGLSGEVKRPLFTANPTIADILKE